MARPKRTTFSRLDYCQYLLVGQTNYTLTNYAEHVDSISHDMVNRYLRDSKLTPSMVWEQTREHLIADTHGYILFDDTVIDKNYSRHIEGVRSQYSGNAHQVIRGIGMVNCIYVNPTTEQFWIIDFRLFDPERDGKTKMDHVREMLSNVHHHKALLYKTVLVDSWYASHSMMLFIHNLGKLFYCPVKSNRLARDADSTEHYAHVSKLTLTDEEQKTGKPIRLKNMPASIPMKLFRVFVSTNRTDNVVTNDPAQHCADDTRKVCAIRWLIEQFHRELKQNTGVDACQCRKQRIQRNHITCAVLVWVRMKDIAYQTKMSIYEMKKGLLRNYLIEQLKNPDIKMSFA